MRTAIQVPRSRIGIWYGAAPDLAQWSHNEALAAWGYVAARGLSEGSPTWRIRKVYVEFQNVAVESDLVAVPTVDGLNPLHGRPYYDALADSTDTDYLRVDVLAAPQIDVEDGYAGAFPDAGTGNLLRLHAQSSGLIGINGLPFDDGNNSKVFGTALVVAPVENDPTQDIVIARGYFEGAAQLIKLPGRQIGVTWEVPFILPS